jgi:predicted cupin superfamily sugar epimerase
VRSLIERYALVPLPVEGVLFARTYASEATTGAGGPVWSAGVGLFCADPPSRSLFHRLAVDEVWHFYAGDPLRLVLLHPDGSDEEATLGNAAAGHRTQQLVPAGSWQAGELVAGGSWALFGCTLAPGFTDDCFDAGHAGDLLQTHPSRAADIARLSVDRD